MKRSEMNAHQRVIFDTMCEVVSEFIGGNENIMLDFAENDIEYIKANEFLSKSHEELVTIICEETMREVTNRGYSKHAKFAGYDFLVERADRRLTKLGY